MNAFRSYLRNSTVYMQLFMLIGLALLGAGLMGAMGFLACQTFYGLSLGDIQRLLADPAAPGAAAPLKLLQIFSSFGLFLLPAMVFSQLYSPQPETFLRMRARISPIVGLLVIILIVAFTPITDALTWFNDAIHLPGFLADYEARARASAENNQALLGAFLHMGSFTVFLYNLFLLAILPAIAEEFFFRGVIQELLMRHTKRTHLSIWITALAFALMHGQIFALIPLLVLGALLGYLKQWTGSLWASILAHFINNGLIVVVMYFFTYDLSDLDQLSSPDPLYLIAALAITGTLIFYLVQNRQEPYNADEDLIGIETDSVDQDGI